MKGVYAMNFKQLPAAASVSATAELCQLSRSRFYDLMNAGVFPKPIHIPSSKRPIYDRTLIEKCLEIRQSGIGFNGEPVLFNRKLTKTRKSIRGRNTHPNSTQYGEVTDALKLLGLTTTNEVVGQAVAELFPRGTNDHDQGEVIRRTFLHLQNKGTSE